MPCNKYNCDCDDSSTCKYKKCKPKYKKEKCWNPYINSTPCYPCPIPNPNPYNPCNPCPTPNQYNQYNPCNPCNPCYQPACAPCNQLKTVNPFLYPIYTIYNGSGNIHIPSVASQSCYIYSITPDSSTSVVVTLPLISSLDNCKKRNFIVSNSGSAGLDISTYNSTDTLNGISGGGSQATFSLNSGQSAQFYSDGFSNNWIIIIGMQISIP